MPCLIKSSTEKSPGIATFTYNEITSPLFKKKKVRNFLNNNKDWIFGVHLQGSYERLSEFPYYDWQSFILCYDLNSKYLKNVNNKKKIDISCHNFINIYNLETKKKYWDLCIISRDAEIKRISYTVKLIKKIIEKKKDIKILIIVPDQREFGFFNNIEKNSYYNLIPKLFKNNDLKKIDFISSNVNTFGNSPLSEKTIFKFLSETKYIMLNSKKEGINRSLIQGFCYGTKAIINNDLESEIVKLYLNNENSIFINDNLSESADIIISNLDKYVYSDEIVQYFRSNFSNNISVQKLKTYIEKILIEKNYQLDGNWYLNNLSQRLCGHGNLNDFQFRFKEYYFFDWFRKAKNVQSNFDGEDDFYSYKIYDEPSFYKKIIINLKKFLKNIIIKYYVK